MVHERCHYRIVVIVTLTLPLSCMSILCVAVLTVLLFGVAVTSL